VYVLDSNHLTILQRTRGPEFVDLQQRLSSIPETDVFVTIVSFHEQIGGWNKLLARPKSQRDVVFAYHMLRRMLGEFSVMQVLSFDDPASDEFLALRRQRIRVGTMDLRIAAITKVHGMTS